MYSFCACLSVRCTSCPDWLLTRHVSCAATDKVECYVAVHPSAVHIDKEIPPVTKPGLFLLAEPDHGFNPSAVKKAKAAFEAKPGVQVEWKTWTGMCFVGYTPFGMHDGPDKAVAPARCCYDDQPSSPHILGFAICPLSSAKV